MSPGRAKIFVVFSVVMILSISCQSGHAVSTGTSSLPGEYEVKAAFLYNIAKFVEWSPHAFLNDRTPVVLCILGENPFRDALDQLKDKTVKNRKFLIKQVKKVEEVKEVGDCHILFISSTEKRNLPLIIESVKSSYVLTVSDMDMFSANGGILHLIKTDNRIGFEINFPAAQRSGLKISSQLLKLAKKVIY